MIHLKSNKEIKIMKEGGVLSREVLDYALSLCKPGITLIEIEQNVDKRIKELGLEPWFKEVEDYPYSTCISVNDVWLHGIPDKTVLKVGDIVSIDIGIRYKGYHLDNCWTIVVLQKAMDISNIRNQLGADEKVRHFLQTGINALFKAIEQVKLGNRTGDISSQMQKIIEAEGYSVIDDYGGHGIGKDYHELPNLLCYGTRGAGAKLKKGIVVSVEVMYAMGSPDYKISKDGWTVITSDRKLSAMFEHTVALTGNGVEILTQ